MNRLVSDIEAHDHHLTTGILGTKYVMEMLAAYGKNQTAMKLILQKTFPGWLNLIEGRTTLPEDWRGGEISVSWTREDDCIRLTIETGLTQPVFYQGKPLSAGHYEFLV